MIWNPDMQIFEPNLSRAAACIDPLVQVGTKQFEQGVQDLTDLVGQETDNQSAVFDLCDSLCESSRELLFRLHRVSETELRQIIDLFERAEVAVRDAMIRHFSGTEHASQIQGYLKHIEGRIRILKRCLS